MYMYICKLLSLVSVLPLTFADNFDHNEDGKLTLKGFLDLHEMTANDEEGGEAELWTIMEAMGLQQAAETKQGHLMNYNTSSLI